MSDIKTVWVAITGRGDWTISNGALASSDDLGTAVLISLFSDRQANDDDVIPDGSADRRGWWGDLDQDKPLGSRLWLLSRSTLSDEVAKLAVIYAKEALQWLIDDLVADSVTVTATPDGVKTLLVSVTINRKSGAQSYQYGWAWNQAA
ncbi:phage GP46 family protein [Pseudomonas lurida]|uniref:phage GP46 family protein n=1 Tax=Pseudomonas lurida TaxID=244566 RepID=UPI001657579E|nr:phage GP46 family protein [Pseudomonas lurida]MBC8984102.1 phage GP46 family protein [Pseudomonas lurida]